MTVIPDDCPADISEEDVLEAMKHIPGYLDITPADFRTVYLAAYRHAAERVRRSVRARDVMTRPVIAVRPETPLAEAAARLADHRISGAPVVDEAGRVVGVISEKDFLARMGAGRGEPFMRVVALCFGGAGCPAVTGRRGTVAEAMSAPAVTVGPEATIEEISNLMAAKSVNRLPVTDAGGRLTGIVTRSSLVAAACTLTERGE